MNYVGSRCGLMDGEHARWRRPSRCGACSVSMFDVRDAPPPIEGIGMRCEALAWQPILMKRSTNSLSCCHTPLLIHCTLCAPQARRPPDQRAPVPERRLRLRDLPEELLLSTVAVAPSSPRPRRTAQISVRELHQGKSNIRQRRNYNLNLRGDR